MKFWLAIDDTDDATKSIGTGIIAQMIYKKYVEMGCDMKFGVTRHQLLLDPAIPYTSHNSAMCLEGDSPLTRDEMWDIAVMVCTNNRSDSSNPGVCLFCPTDQGNNIKLMEFGWNAKKIVLNIEQAFELASTIPDMKLEALNGNGDGVIGALAGVGLRISGNDGTFQGKKKIPEIGTIFSAEEMLKKIDISFIVDEEGTKLLPNAKVRINNHAKIIYYHFSCGAAAKLQSDGIYDICSFAFDYELCFRMNQNKGICKKFVWDNDPGEQWSEQEGLCENCRFRRLVSNGFICSIGIKSK